MSNVVTMAGNPLLTWKDVLERLAGRDDIEHVVIVVARTDGFFEICYDRQSINAVCMSASALQALAIDQARGTLAE